MAILVYVAIGLVIGSISGVMGIGGGVLMVPALIWLMGFETRKAAGTTLAILMLPIGLPAALRAYQEQQVNLEAAIWIALSFAIGAYASRTVVDYIPDEWFRFAFGILMMFVAVRFMIHSDSEATSAAAGISAALLAWLAYFGLKVVGRRNLVRPNLALQIQTKHDELPPERDYQI